MGHNSSLPKVRRKSLRSPFPRRSSSHQSSLSHTFTITDIEQKIEQLNINTATEEELMTLPGVTREVARSIVEHRKAIGRFRKVEDLALVRGIGADKLETIRPEICVTKRRNFSCPSSASQSLDSLRSIDSRATIKNHSKLLDVNKVGVFELQSIHGITQEIAAGIVYYRNKKGSFKQIEDLIKVKNISRVHLDYLRRFLTVGDSTVQLVPENNNKKPNILSNNINGTHTSPNYKKCNGHPLKLHAQNGLSSSSVIDIFELLSAYSPRPILEEKFHYERNGEAAVRIALWNLHEFTNEKANNLGIKEIVCRTILENGWSVIAVQEVLEVSALHVICDELNRPKLRRVIEWKDNSRDWNFCMLDSCDSHLGFIYDLSSGDFDVEIESLRQNSIKNGEDYDVIIGTFKIYDLDVHLVNIDLSPKAQIKHINQRLREVTSEDDFVLVLGDFSDVTFSIDDFSNMQPVLPMTTNTDFLTSKLDREQCYLDNILGNIRVQSQLTGIWGVVRTGLTHLAIPNGWNWGGPVSPHCPVWVELFVTPNVGTAL